MQPYYEGDGVRLFHGDCLEVTEWLAAGVLLADPPYGIGWSKGENRAASSRAHVGIVNDESTATRDDALALWDGPAVVFGSLYAPAPAGVRHVLIWQKPNDAGVVGSTLGWRRDVEAIYLLGDWPQAKAARGSVVRSRVPNIGSPSSPAGRTGHPHAKPVDLLEDLLTHCPPGTVADPFAGSGSTLVAARNLGRPAIGVEIEERYCELIAKRLSQGALFAGAGQ